MQTRKVFFRPSAREVLEIAPAEVATLLAKYLKLLEDFAHGRGVRSTRTEVAGHQSRGQGLRQFTIIHQVGLSQGDMGSYRRYLGTEIEKWIRGALARGCDLGERVARS